VLLSENKYDDDDDIASKLSLSGASLLKQLSETLRPRFIEDYVFEADSMRPKPTT